MDYKVLTLISSRCERDHFDCFGNKLFTTKTFQSSHLDFYIRDGKLKLGNAVVVSVDVSENVLTIKECLSENYSYTTRHYLHSSQKDFAKKLEAYITGKKEWD